MKRPKFFQITYQYSEILIMEFNRVIPYRSIRVNGEDITTPSTYFITDPFKDYKAFAKNVKEVIKNPFRYIKDPIFNSLATFVVLEDSYVICIDFLYLETFNVYFRESTHSLTITESITITKNEYGRTTEVTRKLYHSPPNTKDTTEIDSNKSFTQLKKSMKRFKRSLQNSIK